MTAVIQQERSTHMSAAEKRQEVVEHQPASPPMPVSETAAILSVIERAAANPNVDIEKMERLLEMQERIHARNAKGAFASAFAGMQPGLPSIAQNGRIEIKKDGKVIQSTSFAKWDDISEAIRPVLGAHGFALSFKTGLSADGRVTVTAILMHREGHQEETTMVLAHDSTGSKNAVQAVGSSTSYGKRYTACAILNITTHGEDDDGAAGAAPGTVSDAQIEELQSLIVEVGADIRRFCKFMGVERLEQIPAAKFAEARAALIEKRKKEVR